MKADSDNKIKNENLLLTTEFNKTQAEKQNNLRHEDMQRQIENEKVEAKNDQTLKDTHLKNETEFNKQSGELQNESKKITFDRNA
jgi:hypothetical protein